MKTVSIGLVVAALFATPSAATPAGVRLLRAFQAATGAPGSILRQRVDHDVVTTVPLRIVDASFGPVLLTKRQIKDGCHACVGAIGIYYLRETGRGFAVKRRWPTAIEGWGWGLAPNWSLTDRFTENPAIYSDGGYTGQGLTCRGATITELTPGGPVESEEVRTGLSNVGMLTPDSTEKRVELEGRIAAVQKDRSFEVRVMGTDRFTEHYVKRGGKFIFANGESRLGC